MYKEINLEDEKFKKQQVYSCVLFSIMTALYQMDYDIIEKHEDLYDYLELKIPRKYVKDLPDEYKDKVTILDGEYKRENTGVILYLDPLFKKLGLDNVLKEEYHSKYSDFLCSKEMIQAAVDNGESVLLMVEYHKLEETKVECGHSLIIEDYDEDGFSVIVPHEEQTFRKHYTYDQIEIATDSYFIFRKR